MKRKFHKMPIDNEFNYWLYKNHLEIWYKLWNIAREYEKEQYNIAVVNKRFIELTRDDLVKFKSDLPIDHISIYDFKRSVISIDEISKAELIIFKDGEQIKELKNRYGFS